MVIRPRTGWSSLELGELWRYRELLFFLSWRDVLIRYKQAVLGVAWAVLNPLVTMVVFTLVFGMLLGVQSGSDVPYAVFSYTALLPWKFFAGGLSRSSVSLVARANLLTKVYFPRLVIPVSSVFAGVVDFAIAFVDAAGAHGGLPRALPVDDAVAAAAHVVLSRHGAVGLALARPRSTCSIATCSTSCRS